MPGRRPLLVRSRRYQHGSVAPTARGSAGCAAPHARQASRCHTSHPRGGRGETGSCRPLGRPRAGLALPHPVRPRRRVLSDPRRRAVFEQVRVSPESGTVEWPGEIDLPRCPLRQQRTGRRPATGTSDRRDGALAEQLPRVRRRPQRQAVPGNASSTASASMPRLRGHAATCRSRSRIACSSRASTRWLPRSPRRRSSRRTVVGGPGSAGSGPGLGGSPVEGGAGAPGPPGGRVPAEHARSAYRPTHHPEGTNDRGRTAFPGMPAGSLRSSP